MTKSLLELPEEDAARLLAEYGEPAFRARQLREWLFVRGVSDYEEMTSLPRELRRRLSEFAPPPFPLAAAEARRGRDTRKYLWRAGDGALVESVLIKNGARLTACLSTEVGCAMGCVFCATGRSGFRRRLSRWEILAQYLLMRLPAEATTGAGQATEAAREKKRGKGTGAARRAERVVFMGMGEPLHNYEETVGAARLLNSPPVGSGLAARRITVSTVGHPDKIRALAGETPHLELAISLHAADDKTRAKLVPTAARWKIADLTAAAREYFRQTGRVVTFEYVLIAGVNDFPADAKKVAKLLRGGPWKVNLVPFNPVEGLAFRRPNLAARQTFSRVLTNAGVPVTIRLSKGRDVDAACGQLRGRLQKPCRVAPPEAKSAPSPKQG